MSTSAAPAPSTTVRRAATPASIRRLRRLQVAAVALILVFGALAITALTVSYRAALDAPQTLTQYNRLADARSQALAVQQAANQWSVSPSDDVKAQVRSQLVTVATTLSDAAGVPDDREQLVPLTGALFDYGLSLQRAMALDGEPSAALLGAANDQLTRRVVLPLEQVNASVADRLTAELSTNWLVWVILGAVLAGGCLIGVLVALARASHRYLNPGVAAGVLSVALTVVVVAVSASVGASAATTFGLSTRTSLDALAASRQHLNQARADELLAVGLRSAGTAREKAWTTAYNASRTALQNVPDSTTSLAALGSYSSAHGKVIDASDRSRWAEATDLITGDGAAATAFAAADAALIEQTTAARAPQADAIGWVGTATGVAIAGVLALTLAGAALSVWGVSLRIREYR